MTTENVLNAQGVITSTLQENALLLILFVDYLIQKMVNALNAILDMPLRMELVLEMRKMLTSVQNILKKSVSDAPREPIITAKEYAR